MRHHAVAGCGGGDGGVCVQGEWRVPVAPGQGVVDTCRAQERWRKVGWRRGRWMVDTKVGGRGLVLRWF